MKQSIVLIVRIAATVGLTLAGIGLADREFWFSAVLLFILALVPVYRIQAGQRRSLRRMEQMIAAIRYGDLNISFPENGQGTEGMLNRTMNEALTSFRTRLHRHIMVKAETDAWQKLIRVLTHEIMNSLAPIISLSETVTERTAAGGMNEKEYAVLLEAMRSIHRRSRGLLDFVENYRKLTRIPAPVKQVFSVEDMFRSIRGLFQEEKTAVSYRVEPPDMRLFADRSLIEQVLINLIRNALEATGETESGEIRAEAFERNGRSVLTVSDNGTGIVPEAMDRIFVPFYTTRPGGSGIGLSLSRQIMNRHGGTITGLSEAGKGSLFTIRFSD